MELDGAVVPSAPAAPPPPLRNQRLLNQLADEGCRVALIVPVQSFLGGDAVAL